MQAITTKYRGPTNSRGSRIIVRAQAGRMTVPWDHALDVEENHDAAARAFIARWGWGSDGRRWVRGCLPDGSGNVYVCDPAKFSEELNLSR